MRIDLKSGNSCWGEHLQESDLSKSCCEPGAIVKKTGQRLAMLLIERTVLHKLFTISLDLNRHKDPPCKMLASIYTFASFAFIFTLKKAARPAAAYIVNPRSNLPLLES